MTVVQGLVEALGVERVILEEEVLESRRHDYWFLSQLDDGQGRPAPAPACVVRPAKLAHVAATVATCRKHRAPLVPFGLGSGVCGGVYTEPGAVVIDMSSMNRVGEICPEDLTATFEAGVRGTDAESALVAEGLTLGHYPQSIGVSSVGGWVATRAAGQFSTAYGNIEDIVLDVEAVLGSGDVIRTRRTPRASAGPDLRHLLLGSEGTLGVITSVTLSVRRLPEATLGAAYHVGTMARGLALQREIIQRGYLPPVVRQYDGTEAARMFSAWAKGDQSLLLLVHEGPADVARAERAAVRKLCLDAGAEVADEASVEHWLSERNHVPSFESFIENGVVVDTIEIAATWSRIDKIYDTAVKSLGEVPGILTGSAHSSHAYRSGVNLYFTFAAQPTDRADMRNTYLECWRRVLQATADGGGGIAHHHGIGRVRRDWLESDLGSSGVGVLASIKRVLDPDGIMNPGVLLPERS